MNIERGRILELKIYLYGGDMVHRDDYAKIRADLEKSFFETVYVEIEKRGVKREVIPPWIHRKLAYSVGTDSVATLATILKRAIEEMTRTGIMKEFP